VNKYLLTSENLKPVQKIYTFHRWKCFDEEIFAKQKSCITGVNSEYPLMTMLRFFDMGRQNTKIINVIMAPPMILQKVVIFT